MANISNNTSGEFKLNFDNVLYLAQVENTNFTSNDYQKKESFSFTFYDSENYNTYIVRTPLITYYKQDESY